MMPSSGAELVREFFRAIDACDWEAMMTRVDQNISYERPGYDPFIGANAFLEFYREKRVVASGRHVLENIVEAGDQVVCLGTFSGCSKDGSDITARFADAYTIRNRIIASRRTYFYAAMI